MNDQAVPPQTAPVAGPPRSKRRRFWRALWYGALGLVLFVSGGFFGYSQGPGIATAIAASGSALAAFQKFAPCFNDIRSSAAFRGASSLFRGPTVVPGQPTPTPPPRTFNPDSVKAVSGKLVAVDPRLITVQGSSASPETLPFFAFNRIVTTLGREITQSGLRPGDSVDVLAFRLQEGGPHTVMCVIVDVDP